ncbi:MAG: hypothetical protein ABL895_13145 [Cyclobacteriaceae bacterium]
MRNRKDLEKQGGNHMKVYFDNELGFEFVKISTMVYYFARY